MKIDKQVFFIFVLLALLLTFFPALAEEEAVDLTSACAFQTSGGSKPTRLFDCKYTTPWSGKDRREAWIECVTPEDTSAHFLYVCFVDMPDEWRVEVETDGEWSVLAQGDTTYMHAFVELGGVSRFRLWAGFQKARPLRVNELFVFGQGRLPGWVQRWEPTHEKADLMILAAHPDDELIQFGGLIPAYATELGKKTVVVYMTGSNSTRTSELLNGLWSMGVRQYPVIGPFYDGYSSSLGGGYQKWPKRQAQEFVMRMIRRYKPDVMVTHAVNGEYGHGAHRVCADVALFCAGNSMDAGICAESARRYGVWRMQKLYLHLYGDDPLRLDWNLPLSSLGGITALEAAQRAYLLHATQQSTRFEVTDEGENSSALFGLAYTKVGKDVARDDLFENVIQNDGSVPSPVESLPKLAAAEPKPSPVVYARPAVTCEWPKKLPCKRDAAGYPVSGELVLEDADTGLWFYASPTLVVRIDRRFDPDRLLTWYEAEIFADTACAQFGSVLYNPENPRAKHVQMERIATENQVVFSMNTDYYTYRVRRELTVGTIIRGRETFFDNAPATLRGRFPNLDTIAMFEDGSWGVFDYNEYTADQYLRMGAMDVFSFGPHLLRDGEINPYVEECARGYYQEPRCAIGMIKKGHYFALMAEGRMNKTSKGVTLSHLAALMKQAGCRLALNLDGGQTAAFAFMGRRITRIGSYSGGRTYPRTTTEIIGIGRSSLIDSAAETE